MTDPIADMLTRIRNILRVRKTIVRIPFSNIKYQIAKILKSEGFIGSVERPDRDPRHFIVRVVYDENQESPIRDLRRVSKRTKSVRNKRQNSLCRQYARHSDYFHFVRSND